MIEQDITQLKSYKGKFICVYAKPGIGKTVTTLQTAPDPIYWVTFEPRDLARSVEPADRPDLKLKAAVYENFMDLVDHFADTKKNPLSKRFKEYRTIFADGLSYFMSVAVASEVKIENIDKDSKKPIMDATKVGFDDRGEINQAVFRVMASLAKLSAMGKIVIISCLESDRRQYIMDEWTEVAGPALTGKEVPSNFPGFFDLIGRLTIHDHGLKPEGKCKYCGGEDPGVHYPPIVSFQENDDYLAKYTGKGGKKIGLLNWGKILNV